MNKLNTILDDKKKKLFAVGAGVSAGCSPMVVFAEGESSSGITAGMTSALDTAFAQVKTDVTTIITSALPPALAIMGIALALTVGIKIFKRFAGK